MTLEPRAGQEAELAIQMPGEQAPGDLATHHAPRLMVEPGSSENSAVTPNDSRELLKMMPQALACALEQPIHRGHAHLEDLRDLGVGHLLEAGELDRRALLWRQRGERSLDGGAKLGLLQILDGAGSRGGRQPGGPRELVARSPRPRGGWNQG
jgi:hypothetical protein